MIKYKTNLFKMIIYKNKVLRIIIIFKFKKQLKMI